GRARHRGVHRRAGGRADREQPRGRPGRTRTGRPQGADRHPGRGRRAVRRRGADRGVRPARYAPDPRPGRAAGPGRRGGGVAAGGQRLGPGVRGIGPAGRGGGLHSRLRRADPRGRGRRRTARPAYRTRVNCAVWWLDPGPAVEPYLGLLDDVERDRMGALLRVEDRVRFAAAAALLRTVAGEATGTPPPAV